MDLMNLLRSVEALLYELVSWLVFYPLTLWRCIVHPHKMALYAERELTDPPGEQFVDALSPPLFLFISLVLAHFLQVNFGSPQQVIGGILGEERSLLLFRAVLFSLFPLLVGVQRVRETGQKLTRSSLRPAFYGQCYLVAPFAIMMDIAMIVGQGSFSAAGPLALAIFGVGLAWYLACLTEWFTARGINSRPMAFVRALVTVLAAAVIFIGIAYVVAVATFGD